LNNIDELQSQIIQELQSYNSGYNESEFLKAIKFAKEAHSSQKRASGEPYFLHPLSVASILVEMKMDMPSVITGLLHDTVEDTTSTLMDIQKNFGTEIVTLVDSVTKLSKMSHLTVEARQAEDLRKLVMAMSSDVRVLLIKLADRLHNVRTLDFVSKSKQLRIAKETIDLYTPLAGRIGLNKVKEELEDLCFSYLYPEARASIKKKLDIFKNESSGIVKDVVSELNSLINHSGIDAKILGRVKTPFSIWEKLQRNSITFDQLSDIMAFRIIVDSVPDCYRILGVFHSEYSIVPGRFKDYISTPKSNRYQSLHTCIIGPSNKKIEIQIRTSDMHSIADLGVAAHWSYKQRLKPYQHEQYAWLRGLMDILDNNNQDAQEVLQSARLQMFSDQVFCFTPKGDIVSLPHKSTTVDFAYGIHSKIGDHMEAVLINGRSAPLKTILRNGDQVEIITNPESSPSPSWERFAVTGKALSRIRRAKLSEKNNEYIDLGKKIIIKTFKKHGFEFKPENMTGVLKTYNIANIEGLFLKIGQSSLSIKDVLNHYFLEKKIIPTSAQKPKKTTIPIKGVIPGMKLHFAGCCHPVLGDKIVGISSVGRGVRIHTNSCKVIQKFMDSEKLIPLQWESSYENQFTGRLTVSFTNEKGGLAGAINAVSEVGANIINLRVINRNEENWHIIIDIEVKNLDHLMDVVISLRVCPVVKDVERA
jgi:guanosine-3',5'-bis(diphosphate) 3'-pyrophosphohydrolase